MRITQPPSSATWLLKSLTPRDKSEALLGDLLEEFMQRRSATWYWRQVLAAILVSFAQELRCRWIGVGFAALWTAVVMLFLRRIYTGPNVQRLFDSFFGWATGFAFPLSAIFEASFTLAVLSTFETVAGLMGLGIYLLTNRNFTLRRFVLTASIVFATSFIGNLIFAAFLMIAVPAHLIRYLGYMLESTLVFVILLVAVWTPSVERAGAKSISA